MPLYGKGCDYEFHVIQERGDKVHVVSRSSLGMGDTSGKYRIAGKFGGLAVCLLTAILNPSAHTYVWRSYTKPPNLNPTNVLVWRSGAQPPNLIPTNISGYTVRRLVAFHKSW